MSESINYGIGFWDSVEQTPVSATKQYQESGQTRTTVDAQTKKKLISNQFGIYGLGWGVVPDSEVYEYKHYDDEKESVVLTYKATAFFIYNGERGEFPIAAQILEAYRTKIGKGYKKVDFEAIKKVRTDALTKGFTDLGFCADIHMGKFDDQDYVAGLSAKQQIEDAGKREAQMNEEYEKIKEWLREQVESARTISNDNQFFKLIDKLKSQTAQRCSAAGFSSKGLESKLDDEKIKREDK